MISSSRIAPIAVLLLISAACIAGEELPANIVWKDARELTLEGKAFAETLAPYDRLPAEAEKTVPPKVWALSRDSAGMAIRFVSNSESIFARYSFKNELAKPHMPATGVSGLDLYARDEKGKWRWVACSKPTEKKADVAIIQGMNPGEREYMLYLPLFNVVEELSIGVLPEKTITPGPPRDAARAKPILFWGTSITHGACASRPGMCHTAIVGRWLDRQVINLGFSGNGRMDPPVTALIAKLDPAVYIIDCLPNMGPADVTARTEPLVKNLREARPETPIVLVEDRNYPHGWLLKGRAATNSGNHAALKAAFEKLTAAGVKNLHYLPATELLGEDGDDTTDGSHPSDLGFHRQAQGFEKLLRTIVKP